MRLVAMQWPKTCQNIKSFSNNQARSLSYILHVGTPSLLREFKKTAIDSAGRNFHGIAIKRRETTLGGSYGDYRSTRFSPPQPV